MDNFNVKMLREYRSPFSNSLLCKANGKGQIEIVDKKTRGVVYTGPSRKHNDIGLKGIDFQSKSRDLRCKTCDRLLGRGLGYNLNVEIRCTHCKENTIFFLSELYNKFFDTLPKNQQEKLKLQIKNLTF